jgi:hypothetical protein
MDSFPCDECHAIYVALLGEYAAVKDRLSHQTTTPHDLAGWVQQLNEEECARMRGTSNLWKTWRRMQEHRALTGHGLPLPAPPNTILNPN